MTDPYGFVDWCQFHNPFIFKVTNPPAYLDLIESLYHDDKLYNVKQKVAGRGINRSKSRSRSKTRTRQRGGENEWKPEISTKMSINNIDL